MTSRSTLIVFRDDEERPDEGVAIRRHLRCSTRFEDAQAGDLVFARYCALPEYEGRYEFLGERGARLVNSPTEHRYVSDLKQWYQDLRGITPDTWFSFAEVPANEQGPFVLKGQTYSKRSAWATHMYAANLNDAALVHARLLEDPLVGSGPIYIRRFMPFRSHGTAPAGHPIAHEFRFFVLDQEVLCGGFYWSGHTDAIGHVPDVTQVPQSILSEAVRRIGTKIRFYHLDVGQLVDGSWQVVEVGDGQMAGPSCIPMDVLYSSISSRHIRSES